MLDVDTRKRGIAATFSSVTAGRELSLLALAVRVIRHVLHRRGRCQPRTVAHETHLVQTVIKKRHKEEQL